MTKLGAVVVGLEKNKRSLLLAGAGVAWLVASQLWFYSEKVFGSGSSDDTRIPRFMLLDGSIPLFDGEPANRIDCLAEVVRIVQERIYPLGIALGIWTSGLTLGWLCRRLVLRSPGVSALESLVVSGFLGMGALSLIIQAMGLLGGVRFIPWLLPVFPALALGVWWLTPRATSTPSSRRSLPPALAWIVGTLCALHLGLAIWASVLPTTDYDAHAYHLQGPREYFEAGRITFLPHNVYTSFPFLTEMFPLAGMTITDDRFWGALAGQATLAGFEMLTTLAVGLWASRAFGDHAGLWSAIIYASTPWVHRLTAIPYVEGAMLGFFVMAIYSATQRTWRHGPTLAGLFAGLAFGCKYTALLFVVIPVGVAVVLSRGPGSPAKRLGLFVVGCALAGSPWLIRNIVWTGNPVYPLAYSLFGGEAWSTALAEKFARGHSSHSFTVAEMISFARDILARSDWQGPLILAFAPLALLLIRSRATVGIALLALYGYFAFFYGTHRLDRFFLTVMPCLAVLAGAGMAAVHRRLTIWIPLAVVLLSSYYSIVFCLTPLAGFNRFGVFYYEARILADAAASPAVAVMNADERFRETDTVLAVGWGAVFDANPHMEYSTVFNENAFELLASDGEGAMLPSSEVHHRLRERQIDWILVDWGWIERYRSPGNYGFTEFIQPKVFDDLVRAGVLERVPFGNPSQTEWELFRVRPE